MRKVLYFIFSLLGLAYIIFMGLYAINLIHPFMENVISLEVINMITTWGSLVVIGGFCFVNFFGKSLKIIFFILLVLAVVLYVLVYGFPEIFV